MKLLSQSSPSITLRDVKPILEELISIPSVSGNEHDIADWLANYLSGLGFNVEKIDTPECGPDILASLSRGEKGACLLLYGHMDTIEPVSGWAYPPFKPTLKGSRLYGLGASDMKGGIAAILAAANKLRRVKLRGSLLVAFGSDEELYSRGCDALIQKGKLRGIHAAISAEPTQLDLVEGRGGRAVYEVSVKGTSSHGALAEEGVNAVDEAARFITHLKRLPLKRFRGVKGAVSILSVSGGTEFLSIPDFCRILVDRLLVPGETKETALKQIEKLIADLDSDAKFRVRLMTRKTPFMEPYVLSRRSLISNIVERACQIVSGFKPRRRIELSVGDENYLVVRGRIPTVSIGPKGGGAHAPNEYVDLPSVVEAAKIYAASAAIYLNSWAESD
ncbi:MAG: M20/M25/M40 family metallo-hydrolase [Candidatus Bathyarchaeia archaeon]